jgi:methylated-DNA-[protein]-cysteine S-methyltransferase
MEKRMEANFQKIKSPVGNLYIVGEKGKLRAVVFEKNWNSYSKRFQNLVCANSPLIKETKKQLSEYFGGKRKTFCVPVQVSGTIFQNAVWKSLKKIRFGKTLSYKEQAKLLRSPRAVRAVGRANGMNPICIILPCHRVIGSSGSLTGYGGGLNIKRKLLKLEGFVS